LACVRWSLGVSEVGAGLRQVRLALLKRGLKGPAVDGEQEVTLLHQLPIPEMNGIEVARHTRAHLDGVDRDEPADVLVAVGDQLLHRLANRHLRRARSALSAGLARLAAAEPRQEQEQHDGKVGPGQLRCWHENSGTPRMVHRDNMVLSSPWSRSAREDVNRRDQSSPGRKSDPALRRQEEEKCTPSR
jgi:hypothetical protein